ncbi:lipoprotein lppm proteiN [Caudoviricetes sp.]|nr:lipoprotein lppm proteiN [Caudoviricetes sp.]
MHCGEQVMRLGLAILCLSLLTGCAKLTATTATNTSVCAVWKDVSWSKKDTDQTIVEIKVNNARREAWCHDAKQ